MIFFWNFVLLSNFSSNQEKTESKLGNGVFRKKGISYKTLWEGQNSNKGTSDFKFLIHKGRNVSRGFNYIELIKEKDSIYIQNYKQDNCFEWI